MKKYYYLAPLLPLILALFLLHKSSPILAATTVPGVSSQTLQKTQLQTGTSGSASTVTTPSYNIEFGKVATVSAFPLCGDSSTEPNIDKWDIPDSPASALVDADGNVQLYAAWDFNRKSIGPNLTDVQQDCHVVLGSNHNPVPRQYDNNQWMTAPYTLNGSIIYGLIHEEFHGSGDPNDPNNPYRCPVGKDPNWDCWWNSVNLATSTDKGYTFTQATPPGQNVSNPSDNYDPNNTGGMTGIFGPSNIIFKDGYYYSSVLVRRIPTSDGQFRSCLMRTNNLADPASWRFWNGTDFSTPTRGVAASGNCAGPNVTGTIDDGLLHSIMYSLHWSTYLNQYVNIISRPNTTTGGTNANVRIGPDLFNWVQTIFNIPDPWMPVNMGTTNYFSLLQPGAETRNFEDIGRSPWLYYSSCGGNDCSWAPGGAGHDIVLKRVRVRFNTPDDTGKYDVADLHFNEYKGTKTLDSSFYGNDGTLTGNAALQGANKYVHFGGTGNVTVKNDPSLNLTGQMTITARVRTTQKPAANTFPAIVVKQDNTKRSYGLFLVPGGQFGTSMWNGKTWVGTLSKAIINDGNWHDLQVDFSDSTGIAHIVVDGKLDTTNVQGGSLAQSISTGPLLVGSDGFVGDIDHLTIYNYLLPLPTLVGDLNGDGKVDINDYNIIKSDFGKVGTPGFIPDDINKNGKVDIFDYTILVTAMGSFTPAPSSAPTPIPAPSVTPTPTPTSTPSIPAAVTLYKLVRKTSQNALYTIYTSERDAAITSGGWILGTSTFKVWNTQSDPALVPLYRLHTNADFFYTTSTSESDYAKTIGYTYDGPVFFVYPSAKAGTIPVYRLVGSGYHVYTASSTELSTYQASGFRNEGVTFYAASP